MKGVRVVALTGAAVLAIAATANAAPKTFTFDRAHSEVGFNIRHFFTKVHGRFENYDGALVYDPDNLAASSVQVTIQDSSIYTANERRDAHLRTQDFFWHEKYPTITFKSTKVVPGKSKERFQVEGDLTIRDVTKPVTLDVEYLGQGEITMDGNLQGTRAGFSATTTVNRKDFGIVWNRTLDKGGAMLGDDVEIVLSVSALDRTGVKPPPKPAASAEKTAEKTGDASDKK